MPTGSQETNLMDQNLKAIRRSMAIGRALGSIGDVSKAHGGLAHVTTQFQSAYGRRKLKECANWLVDDPRP